MPGYIVLDIDKEDIPKKYLCSFCGYLLRDARQTPCGHFYCDSCIESLTIDSKLTCLEDGEDCHVEQVYPDNFVRREILSIVMRCPNAESGCKWRGEVRYLLSHAAECNFQKIKCINRGCNEMIFQKDIPDHLRNSCKYRITICSYCSKEVPLADLEKHHVGECMKYPITCPKCNEQDIPRDQIQNHLDPLWGTCSELEGPCPFSPIGCSTKEAMNKDIRAAHLKDKMAFHLSLVQKDYLDLKHRLAIESSSALHLPDRTQDELIKDLISKVDGLMKENVNMKRQITQQNTQLEAMERRLAVTGGPLPKIPSSSINPSTTHLQVSNVDHKQLMNQQSETLTEIRHQIEELGNAQAAMETRLYAQETANGMASVALADITETVRGLSLISHDGVLVWKIEDVARKRADAVSGRETSFYSYPFYSKAQGYKMCARIYLNGDGMGRGNSISLFFVIMRGEYDALLRWPFRQKVTMMLLDQENREHVIDAFRPDPSSSSFQRPRAKMNIASGCPMFCPLTDLVKHAYIQDDTMFIKVIVDTLDS